MSELRKRLAAMSPEKRLLLRRRLEADGKAAQLGQEPIAIVGMGCRFPGGATGPEAYWQMLVEGVDGIVEVPPDRWAIDDYYDSDPEAPGKMGSRFAGFIDDVSGFDPAFFDIDPAEATSMDPQQRLLMEVTWEALEHGGISRSMLKTNVTGVFVGIISHDYAYLAMADEERITTWTGTGSSHAVAAGRISYWLDLRGPCMAIDTACSASLVAVHQACRSLLAGDCRIGLAGGVSLMLSPITSIAATKLSKSVLAADGRCKAFDAAADGMARGEGCGMVVLKRLSHALEDGDRIVALIRATAVNHDGRSAGLTAPNAAAQKDVMQRALEVAGLDAEAVGYLEAHGTGTALGDPIEAQALKAVYGAPSDQAQPCLLASAKTNFGHLEGAAGIAGLIKAAMCVERGFVPAHLHFSALSPVIDFGGTRFEIPTRGRPWLPPGRRYAGISSFGWAGTNAHTLIEQPPTPPPATAFEGVVVLPLSARTPGALTALKRRWLKTLAEPPSANPLSYYDVAWTAAARRSHHAARQCIVASSMADIIAGLREETRPRLAKRRPVVLVLDGLAFAERPAGWVDWLAASLLSMKAGSEARWGAGDWAALWEGLGVRLTAVHGVGSAQQAARELCDELGLSGRAPTKDDIALVLGPEPLTSAALSVRGVPPASGSVGEASPRAALMNALAKLYIAGVDVRWELLRPIGRCVSLPSYPWQRQRYWVHETTVAAPSGGVEVARMLEQDSAMVHQASVFEHDGERVAVVQPRWRNAPGPTAMLPNGLEVTYQSAVELEHFFEDIFEKRVYAKNGIVLRDGDCVFDVGGNIGLTSLFCHLEAKGIQLWTFEPAPPLFKLLKANLTRHGADVHLFNCGVSRGVSTARFTFYPQSSGMSSFYADADEERAAMKAILRSRQRRGVAGIDALLAREEEYLDQRFEAETFECRLRPLSDIIEEHRVPCIDLLKIDVQKAELDVLAGISDEHWPRIRQVVIEVHDIADRLTQVTTLLREHGFEVTSEQDDSYEGSLLYNLYAVRPAANDRLAARTRIVRPLRASALGLPADWPRSLAAQLPPADRPTRWLALSWLGSFKGLLNKGERAVPEVAAAKVVVASPSEGFASPPRPHPRPRLGMLISGLGDQQPSMAHGLYQREPVFRSWLDRAAEILQPAIDVDIRQILYPENATPRKPAKLDLRALLGRGRSAAGADNNSTSHKQNGEETNRLHDIRVAHPLLFAVGYALIQQWSAWGVQPAALLGYSLGEYLAATVAGVFSFEDALTLVAKRAALVHEIPVGAMLAVSCPAAQLTAELGDSVWLAAINGDDLCVVAGKRDAVAQLRLKLTDAGVACQPIASSHAFHTPMLQPAAERLRQVCAGVRMRPPSLPVMSNLTGQWLRAEEATDPDYWARHLCSTVQLRAGLDGLASASTALLEIGPGRSMISLALARAQQCERPAPRAVASLPGVLDTQSDGEMMQGSLEALWQHGLAAVWPARAHGSYPWLAAPPPIAVTDVATAADANLPLPLTRWFYAPSFRRDSAAALSTDSRAGLVVLFAGKELADTLAPRLRSQGARVVVIQPAAVVKGVQKLAEDSWEAGLAQADDLAALWRELSAQEGTAPLTIVHAWSLLAPPEDVVAAKQHGLHSLQALIRSLSDSPWLDGGVGPGGVGPVSVSPGDVSTDADALVQLLVVTQAAHDVVGDELLLPEQALGLAVARCAPQEYAVVRTRAVDMLPAMSPDRVAEQLCRELSIAGGAEVVAWRGRHRWVRDFVPFDPIAQPLPMPRRAVIVITGGLGRVGRLLGRHWAGRGAHVVLTSRQGFAPPQQWAALSTGEDTAMARRAEDLLAMQSSGSVEVWAADATDNQAMEQLMVDVIQRYGWVDGIVHGAGVVGEASLMPLSGSSQERTEQLLTAKVRGAEVVIEAARRHQVRWCALVSSVSSVLGGAGLCSYAASNLYMDVLAQKNQDGAGTRVISYCWDLFSPDAIGETGIGQDLTTNAMAPEDAAAAFEWSIGKSMPVHAVVSVTELTQRVARTARVMLPAAVSDTVQVAYVAPRNELEEMLAELWAKVMKRKQVGVHDNFFDLGGHSLIGAQIVAAVEQEMGIVLSLRQMFEHPTVAQLSLALVVAMADDAGEDELQDALAEAETPAHG